MGFNENRFISPLFKLFGKRLAKVPPSPINGDVIVFNSTTGEWELQQIIIGSAVQSSSNVGSGDGLALPRVLDDLPFKTLVDGVEIVITVSATELAFSIGAIAISKITGLQVALDSKVENAINIGTGAEVFKDKAGVNLRFRRLIDTLEILIVTNTNDLAFTIGAIAQSKITGLVTALASKLETLANVGTGAGLIFRDKIGTTANLKSILAGTDISVTNNADDIEIAFTGTIPTGAPSLLLHNANTEIITTSPDFFAFGGGDIESSIEANAQNSFPVAIKTQFLTIQITFNIGGASTARVRKNGADGNQVIVIPASTTGIFRDVTNNDDFGLADLGNYEIDVPDTGDIDVNSWALEVVNQ